ncbi:MAG: OmpA family protein [Hyphomicrobium sp.]|uniref:OmpA family protein n=1 Tax=Hyphomicrobium sp. TaxID=82 RepID=UPI0039E5F347
MRRWVILLFVLFLSVGAGALTVHFRPNIEAALKPYTTGSSSEAPLAALDTSTSRTSSEPNSTPGANSPDHADKPKAEDGAAQASGGDGIKLDLAQISTSGSTSVFAGRAAPGSDVTVYENDVPVATAKANINGDWSLATDHKFAGPDPKFSLRAGAATLPDEDTHTSASAAASSKPASAPVSEAASQPSSPSGQLLKNFEKKVASAREEAQVQARAEVQTAAATRLPSQNAAPAAPGLSPSQAPVPTAPAPQVAEVAPSSGAVQDSGHPPSASIPVPMTFVFDEATLTPEGEKTAKLLLEYLQLKKFASVTLSGHADERGTAEYNMELSRKRLDAVSAILRGGGYNGKLELLPEGATQPFMGVDRSKYSRDDLMQLDRRVELRNAM